MSLHNEVIRLREENARLKEDKEKLIQIIQDWRSDWIAAMKLVFRCLGLASRIHGFEKVYVNFLRESNYSSIGKQIPEHEREVKEIGSLYDEMRQKRM